MPFEPILAFFLIRYLLKSLRKFSPHPEWERVLNMALYGTVALAIFQFIMHRLPIIDWIWAILLLVIVYQIEKNPIFDFAKKIMYAVLPFILLDIFSDLLKLVESGTYNEIKNYIDFGFAVAITWMIASVIKSNKQQKALEAERNKTLAEEQKSKFIAAKKDELEVLVNERTAELVKQKEELEHTIIELKETQAQLIQSEKMASLGELTAGIAHEIQNPLNFVNNFSEINTELLAEMKNELLTGSKEEAIAIADDIIENETKINHHGKRADSIVKGMLQHSRKSSGQKEPTDINALADEYLRLSYHGLRAKDKSFNATMETNFDETIGKINIIPQDIGRVFLNLFNNSFYTINEKEKALKMQGGNIVYNPTVSVSTALVKLPGNVPAVEIKVWDNGNGIPQAVLDKVFQPFFTTKPTGEGTGLGLSLSYDIVKAHGGDIKVETHENDGTQFIITLPVA